MLRSAFYAAGTLQLTLFVFVGGCGSNSASTRRNPRITKESNNVGVLVSTGFLSITMLVPALLAPVKVESLFNIDEGYLQV